MQIPLGVYTRHRLCALAAKEVALDCRVQIQLARPECRSKSRIDLVNRHGRMLEASRDFRPRIGRVLKFDDGHRCGHHRRRLRGSLPDFVIGVRSDTRTQNVDAGRGQVDKQTEVGLFRFLVLLIQRGNGKNRVFGGRVLFAPLWKVASRGHNQYAFLLRVL